ncbi:hypothetical protein IQ252_09490 [Tychonema sp. LEGE 07203]|nr:hypothetical protein [Tychonema sp. LEGE 07203]
MSQNQQKPDREFLPIAPVATGNVNYLSSSSFRLFVVAVWEGCCRRRSGRK